MSKLKDASDALQALDKLRDALRSPIGTVVTGVAYEMAKGATLPDAVSKHVHVKLADDIDTGRPVTLGDVIACIWPDDEACSESEGGAPRPEAEGAGVARSEETATMFPDEELAGKTQNSNR